MSEPGDRFSNQGASRHQRGFAVDGDRLRRLRVARGWTQLEAAARADLSERLLCKAESGGPLELPSISLLARLYSTATAPLMAGDLLLADSLSSGAAETESLVRRWLDERWNGQRLDVLDQLVAGDCVFHARGETLDLAAARERFAALRATFPKVRLSIDDLAVRGAVAMVRWHVRATPARRRAVKPPGGRRGAIDGLSSLYVEGGRLREAWICWNL